MEARGFLATGSPLLKDTEGDGCQCHREAVPTALHFPACGDWHRTLGETMTYSLVT